ncbi:MULTISPECIES: MFS transporter [Microbacterium]|uniref:MFS transporter n=1 Tax=Microbacterium TaxID=33882 RepID=UPI000CB67AE8|nr:MULTISPECIES: MFS transporter [Microbacterium]PKQ35693.1 MAG: MFS transporter [Actinobacteria bacterium HGW-Actinobacteria-11]MCE0509109.1 MFS transporter [Microbacterium sp. KKR3/1]MCK8467224.1 MFS transporter [Microbacterium aurugineum]MCK8476275.1 MFS transporter [Microbacterium aurugineum]MCZ4300156.1 MFS transporter [Microbacterium oxydans]
MTELSSAANAAAVGTTGFKAPGTTPSKTPRGYAPGLAAVNFGVYLALLTPVMVSMAFKIQHIDPVSTEASLGLVMSIGAAFALVANPLVGRLSDRTTSRWGMRRPWILGGAIVGLGGFLIIGVATSVWMVLLAWCLVQASMNAVLAAANATLPDQVPVSSRGKVSGIIGITTPIGILAGSFIVNFLPGDFERFVVPAVIALILVIVFVLVLQDRRLTEKPAERFTVGTFFGSFVFNPRKHPDFGWTWLTKFFVMFGYAGIATYLPLYLITKFGLDEQGAVGTILLANLASMAAMAISSPLGGFLSDKIGKRRPFVAVAGVIMVVGLVILAVAPDVTTVVVAQAIIGLGAGSFLSVDLALATEVLPNPADTAKDLGVLNIANALPQSIAPAIAPAIIALGAATPLGGYTAWYLFGALVALAGALLVYRIKGVK